MKYKEIFFTLKPYNEDFTDILSAWISNLGFESFVNTPEGLIAYIQSEHFEENALKECLLSYPVPQVQIEYQIRNAPDENWNETWETEGFKPITIGNEITVHDSRFQAPEEIRYDILINPRLAFGTGSHETTRMILSTLLQMDLTGRKIVDAGTGTGILSIMARKKGARNIVAYDIDEWSVENTKENLKLNGIKDAVEVLLGDASVLKGMRGVNLLMANINRNILLNDLPLFYHTLAPKGQLLMSGFLKEDIPQMEKAARKLGLREVLVKEDSGWAMLLFEADASCRMDV